MCVSDWLSLLGCAYACTPFSAIKRLLPANAAKEIVDSAQDTQPHSMLPSAIHLVLMLPITEDFPRCLRMLDMIPIQLFRYQ